MSKKRKPQLIKKTIEAATPKTPHQNDYIKAIRNSSITICTGLPGTGKTFLAVSEAVKSLKEREVRKIIISRPVVEAGESLGYLPGGIDGKARPYLMPVFDALKEFLSSQELAQLQNQGKLEISPLAYMRGRTFKDAFVILDEAQNATLPQMKMFLTRIGGNSKIVICGDTKQSDIRTNDLSICIAALYDIKGISHISLTEEDIIRHKLIGIIVKRLEEAEQPKFKSNGNGKNRITSEQLA